MLGAGVHTNEAGSLNENHTRYLDLQLSLAFLQIISVCLSREISLAYMKSARQSESQLQK